MCPSLGQSNGPSNTFTPVIRQPRRQKKASIENRFKDALERDQAESGEGESMYETLSEAGEGMGLGTMHERK